MKREQKIGLVTGVFDLLHREHLRFLRRASKQAGTVWVGIESDARVKLLKGEARPYNVQAVRMKRLQQLLPEVKVEVLPEDFGLRETRERFVRERGINCLIVSNHDRRLADKKKEIEEMGGELIILRSKGEISSTKIVAGAQGREWLVFEADRELLDCRFGWEE